jgi:FkbM family methyltransferase
MVLASACDGPLREDAGAVSPDPGLQPETTAEPESEISGLLSTIDEIRERLRSVPGRSGILAEPRRYSLFDEELIIRDFFQDREGGFFVDLGCAWPIEANNTYYLEKHLGWRGIGVDALAEYAPAWEAERPASRFFTFLVADHSSTDATFFRSESPGLSSADRSRADGTHFGGRLGVEEVHVPSTTLDDLLEHVGVERIDLLAMDIEGHELAALRGIDLDRFRPQLVVTEGRRADVATHLYQNGYELIERYLPFDPVNTYYRRRTDEARR